MSQSTEAKCLKHKTRKPESPVQVDRNLACDVTLDRAAFSALHRLSELDSEANNVIGGG